MRYILLTLFAFVNLFSKNDFEVIFQKSFSDLPIQIRIENCGIYAISDFYIENDFIYLKKIDDKELLSFRNNNFIAKIFNTNKNLDQKYKNIYFNSNSTEFLDNDDYLTNNDNEKISVIKKSNSELLLIYNLKNFSKQFSFIFNNDLACADLVGMDKFGNTFLVVEQFISQIPLKVSRTLFVINSDGQIISKMNLIMQKYLYLQNEFKIDSLGNFYQLISDKEKISILKWHNSEFLKNNLIDRPSDFNEEIHFNSFTPTNEYISEIPNEPQLATNRTLALKIGDSYVNYKYTCKAANLAPNGTAAPDGDQVKTPSWLIEGQNARLPYKWGGFDNLSTFQQGLNSNKFSGDINTSGVSSYAVGVDCSGFVSRCWQLTYHSSTSAMPNITTQYASWNDLKPGDAIHKVGHVRLFVKFNQNGSLKVVESAGRNWDVSYWSFTYSDLATYTPRYYNNMATDYSDKWIKLLSIKFTNQNTIELRWASSDTSNTKGYKIYESSDGINYSIRYDENTIKDTFYSFNYTNKNYYRISAVSNNTPFFTESFWSNSLFINLGTNQKKILLVNGFNRNDASYQGTGHNFLDRYGKASKMQNYSIESCSNQEVVNGNFDLKDYDIVFHILGDESVYDETLGSIEQDKIKQYLEAGGGIFISGSEIGFDLYQNGNTNDKYFYQNYLKASYLTDKSSSNVIKNSNGSILDSTSFVIGQTYYEDSPDVIVNYGGSEVCLTYNSLQNAGINFKGKFGSSNSIGKLIYLAFALETTANDKEFENIISKSIQYLTSEINKVEDVSNEIDFVISNNYPNPFNSNTKVEFNLRSDRLLDINLYNNLGQRFGLFQNQLYKSGRNILELNFSDFNLSSGNYWLEFSNKNQRKIIKLIYLK